MRKFALFFINLALGVAFSGASQAQTRDIGVHGELLDRIAAIVNDGLVLKSEADGGGGVRFMGDFSYTARFDGKQYDLKNSRNDTVTIQLVDPHTVEAIYRRDNQVAQTDRWVVSSDGQRMTVSTTGTLETGQHLTERLTFKRQ